MKAALRIIQDSPSIREAYFFLDNSAVVDGLLGTPQYPRKKNTSPSREAPRKHTPYAS